MSGTIAFWRKRRQILRQEKEAEGNADINPTVAITFDEEMRSIDFLGPVSMETLQEFKLALDVLKKNCGENQEITITVSSGGGDAMLGLAIYDLIRSSGLQVKTVALGQVASAGLAIFLAGDKRLMYENSVLCSHKARQAFGEDTLRQEIENTLAQLNVIESLYRKIILENSSINGQDLDKMEQEEKNITAQEAMELRLADGIIENRR